MTLVPVTSKRKGSPKETVRIYKSGTARLSADLVIASQFDLWVDQQDCVLKLIPVRASRQQTSNMRAVWFGNPSARSAFIAVQTALDMLHLTPEKACGLYRAVVIDGCVVVALKKKLKE